VKERGVPGIVPFSSDEQARRHADKRRRLASRRTPWTRESFFELFMLGWLINGTKIVSRSYKDFKNRIKYKNTSGKIQDEPYGSVRGLITY
jgi:hypothetical protein